MIYEYAIKKLKKINNAWTFFKKNKEEINKSCRLQVFFKKIDYYFDFYTIYTTFKTIKRNLNNDIYFFVKYMHYKFYSWYMMLN